MAKNKRRISTLKPLEDDLASFARMPETAQTRSPTYRLAFVDEDFMRGEDLRAMRLQLEYLKIEYALRERGVTSTVILFGGARIPAPGATPKARTDVARTSLEAMSRYYDEARLFARRVGAHSLTTEGREFVVTTGGGPGIMEAGARGAADVGAPSIGLNIVLPFEETPNRFTTPELSFNFHYFAIRKMHFLMRARAIAVFPGGFGTLDELFEALTLIQTKRMQAMPILLFGRDFWRRIIDFDALRDSGTISPEDIELFTFVDTADEAWATIRAHYSLPA